MMMMWERMSESELPKARFKIYEKLSLSPPATLTLILGISCSMHKSKHSFECVSRSVCVCVRVRVCVCDVRVISGGFISIQFGNKTIIPQKLCLFGPASRK